MNGYSDAVVAIAVTLLVLPLTAIEVEPFGGDVRRLVEANFNRFLSFLVSFVLISGLWIFHHRLIRYIDRYDDRFVLLNTAWLLTIVFLPFPTYVMGSGETVTKSELLLYYGTLVLSSLCLSLMRGHAYRHDMLVPDVLDEYDARRGRVQGWVATGMLALIFAVLASGRWLLEGPEALLLGCLPLVLLLLTGPIASLIIRTMDRNKVAT